MTRTELGRWIFGMATLLASATAAAQAGPLAAPVAAPPPTAEPGVEPPALTTAPAPPPPPVVTATPATRPALEDLTGSIGFGVGVIPNTELVGTTGAVALKYWIEDALALSPLFSFAYDKPRGVSAAWHLRPEAVVLFVPFSGRWTRFEVGGGLGFEVGRAAPASTAYGPGATPNTTFTLSLPVQAGVEHFFSRWFSLGIAAHADLFSFSKDGDYHEVSFSIDSTSLLAQLFIYTD